MGRGGYFNNNSRRSGGFRRTVIHAGDVLRQHYLKILKERIAATGLTGPALREVYERLEATETDVLRDCVKRDAVGQAERRVAQNTQAQTETPEGSAGQTPK